MDSQSIDIRNKNMISQLVKIGSLSIVRDSETFISSSRLLDKGEIHKTKLYIVNI